MTDSHTTEQDLANALHVAIDFETLSLSPRAAIVGVAAAVFGEPEWPRLLFSAWPISCGRLHSFDLTFIERRDDLTGAGLLTSVPGQPDREVDEGTVTWHKRQVSWPTTFAALRGEGPTLADALRQLVDAVKQAAGDRPVLWYSRPSAFDGAVLLDLSRWSSDFRDAEAQLGGPARVPLHRRVRCMRTLQHDASLVSTWGPMLWRKADVPHDPRSDVMADAVSAHECLRVLRFAVEGLGLWHDFDQTRQILEQALQERGIEPDAGRGTLAVVKLAEGLLLSDKRERTLQAMSMAAPAGEEPLQLRLARPGEPWHEAGGVIVTGWRGKSATNITAALLKFAGEDQPDDEPSDRSGAVPELRPPGGMSWDGVQEYSIDPDAVAARERVEQVGDEERLRQLKPGRAPPLSVQIIAAAAAHGRLTQIVDTLQECVAGRRPGGRDDIIGMLRETQHEVDAALHAAWQHCASVTIRPDHVRIELMIRAVTETVALSLVAPVDEYAAARAYLAELFPGKVGA